MREVIDAKGLDSTQPQYDPALTLGPVMLLGLLFFFLLICAGVFGWGYAVGHRGSGDSSGVMKPAPDAPASLQAGCAQSKPAASLQAEAPTTGNDVDDPVGSLVSSEASGTDASATSPGAAPVEGAGASTAQPQVRPALAAAGSAQAAAGPGGGLKVEPALVPAGGLMVQIAAVSHQEDADVLTNALRKRGYVVNARREAADGMVHVRIGPFTSRDEANRWRQKLMDDGYNAIVQP
jgi:cell division septation protein DedD